MSFHVRRVAEEKLWKKKSQQHLIAWLHVLKPVLLLVSLIWRRRKEQEERKRQRFMGMLTIIIVTVACTVSLLWLIRGSLSLLHTWNLSLNFTSNALPKDNNGYTNILLVGQGDAEHDGQDLTDSIMIASIDETKNNVFLLSLPRDLYVLHPRHVSPGRINAMYRDEKYRLRFQEKIEEEDASIGALKTLAEEISLIANLPLHHVIKIDFIGFIKAIDALKGIVIDVPFDIIDTEYPGPNYTTQTFIIRKGHQTLDGETALKYARSRHTSSDFDRSARQQQILTALAKQARTKNLLSKPQTLTRLLTIIQEHLETTLNLRELLSLAKIGKRIDPAQIVSLQLNDRNGLYDDFLEAGGFLYTPPRDQFDGASVLLPLSIPEFPVTWRQIHTLTQLFFGLRTPYIAPANITILNAGSPPGSARKLGSELKRYGLTIGTIENTTMGKRDSSALLQSSHQEYDTFLSSLLQLPIEHIMNENEPREDPTIILGKEYRFRHLQNLVSPPLSE